MSSTSDVKAFEELAARSEPEAVRTARACLDGLYGVWDDEIVLRDLLIAYDTLRAEERARADTITPAMIQAAQDRVQGSDEDMYSAIYRAMRGAAYIADNRGEG